jgi:deazaflavin-dependent oxidoreductase (nitroreductase family)
MAFPARLARFNRRVTNPILGRIAGRVVPFALVIHRGRTSGREYRTPVMAFTAGDRVVIALTYGTETDWVRNLLAAGGGRLVQAGRTRSLDQPEIVALANGIEAIPRPIRPVVRLIGVTHCLRLRSA